MNYDKDVSVLNVGTNGIVLGKFFVDSQRINFTAADMIKYPHELIKKYPMFNFIKLTNLYNFPFPGNTFDIVTAVDILEHVKPEKTFHKQIN